MTPFVAWSWAGVVLGVSFLASPVKFRAASLNLPVALDVGRATFHALARVEWVLAGVLAVGLVVDPARAAWTCFGAVIAIVAAQALYLIPRLDDRVAAVIAEKPLDRSHLHTVFAVVEAVKVGLLITTGALAA